MPLRGRGVLIAAALIVGLFAVACGSDTGMGPASGSTSTPRETVPTTMGKAAPSFRVETFHHGVYDLDETIGRPVLINFWFPSCPPCRAEMPDLQAAYEQYGDEVDFIGVQQTSIDKAQEGVDFLEELGITYPNFADQTGETKGAVQIDYQVLSYPTTVFLNRDHSVHRTWQGLITESNLRQQIEAIINS